VKASANSLIDFKLAKSSFSQTTCWLLVCAFIKLTASAPFFVSLQARTTVPPLKKINLNHSISVLLWFKILFSTLPRLAKSNAVSSPIPVLAPVTITTLPFNLFVDLHLPPLK
jgi:hypothetical protein